MGHSPPDQRFRQRHRAARPRRDRAGLKADINVIDYANLRICAPEVLYDLPAGGRRLVQRTQGYTATIVSGVPVHLNNEATGELPGRLIRGAVLF